MRINLLSVTLLCLLAIACNKKDKATPEPPLPTVTLSMDSVYRSALPGDALIVKLNKRTTLTEVNIMLGSSSVKGYANGDSAYVFLMPVLAPGDVSLSIPAIERSNTLTVTIKSYTAISNAQTVINNFTAKRNSCIDSITKVVAGSNFQPSPESITLINQLKEEWDTQVASLAAADKELLAYVLERNMPDPTQSSFTPLPAGYYGRVEGIQSDVADKLVAAAKVHVTVQTVCIATIPPLLVSGIAFLVAPNPVSALIFLGLFTTFVISRESAIRRAQEVGKLNGVAEAITGSTVQRVTAVEFYNNTEKTVSMTVGFRNLKTGDEGLQSDISSAFSKEQTFISKDKEVEAVYNKAKEKTTKLKAAYPSATGSIGKQAQTSMQLPIDGSSIIVKSVSDSRISFTSSLSGTSRKVKITSTATTEFNFDLVLAYKRTLDNKEITQNVACYYKPEFDSTAMYKASVIGYYTVNNYKGNGPNSRLYADFKADGRTEYIIYDDPSWANGYKFGASWGIQKLNGRYYFSESGFWHYGFGSISPNNPLTYPVTGFKFHNDTYYSK